jgi:hypothetical protein
MKAAFRRINQTKEDQYIDHLLQTVLEEPLIRKRFIEMLILPPFERRIILNTWIEKYWLKNTGPEIIQALACLFDNKVAEQTLKLIKNGNLTSYSSSEMEE